MSDDTAQCGTVRGYLFHLWSGTWVCSPCDQAHAAFSATSPPGPVQLGKKHNKTRAVADGYAHCRTCDVNKAIEMFRPSEFGNSTQVCKSCRAAEQARKRPRKRIAS